MFRAITTGVYSYWTRRFTCILFKNSHVKVFKGLLMERVQGKAARGDYEII